MKILVTGANGYLGQGIVKTLLNYGHNVIATDLSTQYIDKRAISKACNIFEIDNPYLYFNKPEVVLHLAWRNGFVHHSETHIEDLPKHYNFIKKITESNIHKIVVMGSMHEIGFFEGSIQENTPCHPLNLYGISKNALREITKILAKQNDILFQWLRGYYIVDNSSFGNSIFSKIVSAAEKGVKEFPFNTGQNQYDFISYSSFCEQVAATVSQDEITGIINICSGKPEKLAECIENFIKVNKLNIHLQYGAFPERPYDSKAIWGDNTKINKIMKQLNSK
jgi:dTDP-6-deoxy-L-talose 4-dehydrogenase (NAD+)